MISTAQVIFSGEPSMTLKVSLKFGSWSGSTARDIVFLNNFRGLCLLEFQVLPVLLFGAKYGGLVTVWRLVATRIIECTRYKQQVLAWLL
jgi:hypothetical protein